MSYFETNIPEEELFDVEFTISYIIFKSETNDFAIFKASNLKMDEQYRKDSHSQISIKGIFPKAEPGDVFKGRCKWSYDNKYGYSLDCLYPLRTLPSNINGIRHFLIKNVKGVGEKTVEKIIKAYGEASLDRIKDGGLDGIKGISDKVKKRIIKKVMESQTLEDLSLYLFQRGVTNYQDVVDIYNEFGEEALDKVMSNPYSICQNTLSRFPLADKIALNSGLDIESHTRKQRVILYYIHDNMFQSGNLFEYEKDIIANIHSFMRAKGIKPFHSTTGIIKEEIDSLVKSGQLKAEASMNIPDNRFIYLPWVYKKESDTAETIRNMLKSSIDTEYDITDFLRQYSKTAGIVLDKVQEKGVENAINHRISILTGGPGTGKTLTINAIIQCINYINPGADIVLTAPTGRAAKRMSEMTGISAMTIHRLLGLRANWEYVNEDISLEADYVIVDESSMIDHNLFHILLKAVYEAGASLILVGDKDQLPPVGAGLPFRDMIESGAVPVVKLQNLYRQAGESQININAQSILKGITKIGEDGLQFDLSKQDFFFFPALTPEQIIKQTIKSMDALSRIGAKLDDITVLSPMRKTDVGVINLNKILQEHLNPASEGLFELRLGSTVFRVGDRIMQTKNNYNLGVFNGDIGKITAIDDEDEMVSVLFDDYKIDEGKLIPCPKTVVYDYKELNEITLAYATTVHKSQGSEYPIVIMPLSPLLINTSRTILYTAVTRAKAKFVFIGDTESLRRGIEKVEETKRNTRLRERIRG